MKLLSIESSAKAASVCLTEDGRLVSQYYQSSALTHSRTLLKMAEELLFNLDMKPADLDSVAVAVGPGSFTGVRIGVAAAKGLCWGAGKPVIGVSTLEAMAYQLSDREGAIILPAMDARRGEVYNAKFLVKDGAPVRLCEDRAVSAAAVAEEMRGCPQPVFAVGDGAEILKRALEGAGVQVLLPPEPLLMQTAWGVAMAARGREPQDAADLTPRYLRLSQAERERLQKLREQ